MIVELIRFTVSWLCSWSWGTMLPILTIYTLLVTIIPCISLPIWIIVQLIFWLAVFLPMYLVSPKFFNSTDNKNKSFWRTFISGYVICYSSLLLTFVIALVTGCTANNLVPGNIAGDAAFG